MPSQDAAAPIQFLKLGGSLITDKAQPHSPRPEVLRRLAGEIAGARHKTPGLKIILGHGSGSFGHVPAQKYGTRQGVKTPEQWLGFQVVWGEAAALNHLVIEALIETDLPAISFPPSASILAVGGLVERWDISPIQAALDAGLLPVVYGDVVFDRLLGGTILSTEDLFEHLAAHFRPSRLLLAGREPGVWADYPACTRLLKEITPKSLERDAPALSGSAATDVTGGMASKVQQGLRLCQQIPGLQVLIFSAETPGALEQALSGERIGTLLRAG